MVIVLDKHALLLIALLGIAVAVGIFSIASTFSLLSMQATREVKQSTSKMSDMTLMPFDEEQARQMMDQNGDGMCDFCGMPVAMCIISGQIQCNMGPNSTIGILNSRHIHADWKIYIDGEMLDEQFFIPIARSSQLTNSSITSSFIHVEASPGEKTGDVIHMHATGVTLWLFFRSVEMNFNSSCLSLRDGQKFCNGAGKTLKFYVNGEPNAQWGNYVLNDGDRILISYGNEIGLGQQLGSITNFSGKH
ncbi:MAG TPA: hypothetical protein HA230_00230 [Candidatus Aenigmarchaeota archaeon]|nr:hypothetical protein [Candidatus Aenigmarchaeota archaeon]